MCDLGSLRDDNLPYSEAFAISADGSTVVGRATTDGGSSHAYRWIDDGSGMLDLGTLRDDNLGSSRADAVSADGSTIVGLASAEDGGFSGSRAFMWIDDGSGMLDLGTLRDDNLGSSLANGVSADGGAIVGYADTEDGPSRAFRWVDDGNGMLDLGSLRDDNLGSSRANAVSADGSTIVGQADIDGGPSRAFRWIDDGSRMLDLGTLRDDNLGFSIATAVSADGGTIVGYSETDDGYFTYRAFIWRTQMQDFENLALTFPALAHATEIAVAQQQHVLGRLTADTCLAEADQSCLRFGGWLADTAATDAEDLGSRSSSVATLSYGRGLEGQITVGGTLSVKGTDLGANGFDMDSKVGASLWVTRSQGTLERTGWQVSAAIGYGRDSGAITRGRGIEDVMLATGDAALKTLSARATLGYGLQHQSWVITPSAALAQFRTNRSAYAEDGADFNASYDDFDVKRTTATLAFSVEHEVSAQSVFSLRIGMEHDLSANRVVLTGTSEVPGMEILSVGTTLERNTTRSFFDLGYAHDLGNNRNLSGSLLVGQAAYGSAPLIVGGINFGIRF